MGDEPVTPALLHALGEGGHLDSRAYRRARQLAGFMPGAAQWREFLARVLAAGAGLMLATAMVFFIAFNWQEMGRFFKLALLEGAVIAAAVAAIATRNRPMISKPAYLAATILTGALLAFIGQTYQTGADPWQLFATWAVLSLPWAFAASWAPVWALLLVLADLAIALYFLERVGLGWLDRPSTTAVVLVGFNAVWVVVGGRSFHDSYRLVVRTAGLVALGAATAGMLLFIFMDSDRAGSLDLPITWLLAMAGGYYAWRILRRDLLMLSAGSLAAIVVATAAFARMLGSFADSLGVLIALMVVGLSAWAAHWIRSIAKLPEGQ